MVVDLGHLQNPDGLKQILMGMKEDQASDKLVAKAAIIASEQKAELQEQQSEEKNPLAAALRRSDRQIKAHTSSVKKAKEAKLAQKKLMPPKELEEGAQQFSKRNPQFPPAGLLALTEKLKDGMSKQDILEMIHKEYPNPIEASLALEFLISVALEDFKDTLQVAQVDLNKEIIDKREQEVAHKVETEAKKATQEATEAALKIVQGGDLNKLLDYLMSNPIEATAIYKMLDEGYGKNLKKIESFLLKKCGIEINKLKKLDDKEDVAHMKNTMALLKKLQAIMGVDRYFEIRNASKPIKAARAG
ncbi:hypothetical protein NEOC84_000773|uniref:hypothetical protein n=1 Tax=Neochlamydia sp. AcF84 TaxID=2315858 RepID=UPI00140C83C9|nr:hypothetical protein [Neochlamydia sp. AcF84]NGY94873.1 hypothetical protein [Neochlamydia sp. AcF84]